MPTDVGYTYQPGAGNQNGAGGQTGGRLTPQEALRILSFRVPKRPAQGALAPASLLPGATTQGADASSLNQIIGALMRSFPSAGGSQSASPVSPMGGGSQGGGNVSFTPGGGGGSAIPWQGQTRPQAPTFTPGDDGRGGSATDLFGQDISRDGGGGGRQDVPQDGGLSDTFGGWLDRERSLNGRGGMPNLEDRFRF